MNRKLTRILIVAMFILSLRSVGVAAEKGRQTEVEMHHPKGWQFTMPEGDPVKGRAVFDKFSCSSCHEVRGEKFPVPDKGRLSAPS